MCVCVASGPEWSRGPYLPCTPEPRTLGLAFSLSPL